MNLDCLDMLPAMSKETGGRPDPAGGFQVELERAKLEIDKAKLQTEKAVLRAEKAEAELADWQSQPKRAQSRRVRQRTDAGGDQK